MITARRESAAGLHELALPHLASLVDNALDFVAIAGTGGEVTFLNAAGRALVGLPPDAALPALLTDYLAEPARVAFSRDVLAHVRREGRWEGELTLRRIDGRSFPAFARIFYLKQPSTGRRVSMAVICRDVSATKLADDQLHAAESALAYATRLNTMGEIAASIAHDVSQPLGAILSNADACVRWLDAAKPDVVEARDAATRIVRDVDRATQVLDRVRDVAKRDVHELSTFRINRAIRWVMALLAGELRIHQVECILELDDGLPPVRGDAVQIQQVILNLVMNGIEAMKSVQGRERRLTVSSKTADDNSIEVRVRDSGRGITASDISQIFDPIYTTKRQGMGLGLPIARRIVRDHGGSLWATSNPDQGATLSFTLPCAPGSTA